MDKIKASKKIARAVVGCSVSAVIVTGINQNVTVEKKRNKIAIYIGAYVMGAMVAKKAETWTDEKMDSVIEALHRLSELKL